MDHIIIAFTICLLLYKYFGLSLLGCFFILMFLGIGKEFTDTYVSYVDLLCNTIGFMLFYVFTEH